MSGSAAPSIQTAVGAKTKFEKSLYRELYNISKKRAPKSPLTKEHRGTCNKLLSFFIELLIVCFIIDKYKSFQTVIIHQKKIFVNVMITKNKMETEGSSEKM